MPDLPAVPDVLPGPPPELVLPCGLPLDLPAEGRAALAAALEGPLPAGQRPKRGEPVRESVPSRWNDEEITRLRGFLRTVADRRGRQGRSYPLEYLLTLPLIAGMAGDGELDAAAEWAATAPEDLLPRLGAALGRNGQGIQPRQLRETLHDQRKLEQPLSRGASHPHKPPSCSRPGAAA